MFLRAKCIKKLKDVILLRLPNGKLYRARGGLADKCHRVEPDFGAESLRDEAKPAPRPVQAVLGAGL